MLIAITTAVYVFTLIIITYYSKKQERTEDFLIASRELGWKSIGFSVFASLISSFNIVIGITFAYIFGVYYLVIFLSLVGAYIFFYYLYKNHKELFKSEKFLTVVDYFRNRFGITVGRLVEIIFAVVLLFFITLQINVNTQVFTALFGINKYVAVVAIAGIVLAYVMVGGFKTVVKTDVFQGLFMLIIVALAFFVGTEHITTSAIVANISNTTLLFSAIALVVVQFLSLVSQPELWQRVYAAKNANELRRGFAFSFVLLLVVLVPITFIGLNASLGGLLQDPGNAFFEVLSFGDRTWFVPIVSVSLLAAFMSTLD
jgi:Na+/proline symporter